METLRKLMKKKYFYVIFFCVVMLIFGILLQQTIVHDMEHNAVPDPNMIRVDAVVKDLNSYTITDEKGEQAVHYNVLVTIKVSENERYDNYPLYDVPKTDINRTLTVKYDESVPGVFYYDDIPKSHYRTVLYVLFSACIAASLGAAIFASRFLQHREFVKNREEWMKSHPGENLPGNESAQQTPGSYEGFDGKDEHADLNPFGGSDMDYNALYEYDQKMNDASYSAEGTYSGYETDSAGSAGSQHPMDTQYDPSAPYTGYEEPRSHNPMDAPYGPTAPYTGYEAPRSHNPMDAQYDPFAPYTGYDENDS